MTWQRKKQVCCYRECVLNKVQKSEFNYQIFKLKYFKIVSNIAFFVCNPIIYSLMNIFLEIIFYFYFLSLAVIKQNELNARLSLLNPDELHGLNTLCLQGTLFTELFSMFCKTPICNYLVNMHRHQTIPVTQPKIWNLSCRKNTSKINIYLLFQVYIYQRKLVEIILNFHSYLGLNLNTQRFSSDCMWGISETEFLAQNSSLFIFAT